MSLDGWSVVGATARGTSHIRNNLPCQDAVAWWLGPTALVAACADGAGSAPRSEDGAKAAVGAVVARARQLLDNQRDRGPDAITLARSCMRAARREIGRVVEATETSSRAFATTLALCVVAEPTVCLAQIGDGVACVGTPEGLIAPFPPPRRMYANEAVFITAGKRLPHATIATYRAEEIKAFSLSSDGLRLVITRNATTGEPYEPFFTDLFAFAARGGGSQALAGFLESVDDRTDDDKSLVVGVRAGAWD
jgi:Protein phosphatase 2C